MHSQEPKPSGKKSLAEKDEERKAKAARKREREQKKKEARAKKRAKVSMFARTQISFLALKSVDVTACFAVSVF